MFLRPYSMNNIIDLVFPITGVKIAVDHRYMLYSAIVQLCPQLHTEDGIGVHSIRGKYAGDGFLKLTEHSKLVIRMPKNSVTSFLCLAGKILNIGDNEIEVGVPDINYLVPRDNLYAHLVTTKDGVDEDRFKTAIMYQLKNIGVNCKFNIGISRSLRIHGKQIVGYSMTINDLTHTHSLILQANGLGGRRKMGCGIFVR